MHVDEWGARWRDGKIGFHQSKVSSALEEYADEVFGSDPGRVLVPLCGKTLDMVFLAERANTVVGIEYVEQAVQEFFAEHKLTASIDHGPPIRYAAQNLLLFVSDIFEIDSEHVGTIDAVFDRAALVALVPEVRIQYAAHLSTILPVGAKMLLVTFDYDQSKMQGPPFAVSNTEVADLFSGDFEIEHLRTRDVLDDRFREQGLISMTESTLVLTKT